MHAFSYINEFNVHINDDYYIRYYYIHYIAFTKTENASCDQLTYNYLHVWTENIQWISVFTVCYGADDTIAMLKLGLQIDYARNSKASTDNWCRALVFYLPTEVKYAD